jgi:hypothetical protein
VAVRRCAVGQTLATGGLTAIAAVQSSQQFVDGESVGVVFVVGFVVLLGTASRLRGHRCDD